MGLSPKGLVVPRLARDWQTLENGRLRFTLRADARFPDGSPVSAEDVLWTLRELLRNPEASPTKRAILAGAELGQDLGCVWIHSPKPPERLLRELARVPPPRLATRSVAQVPLLFRRSRGPGSSAAGTTS